MKPREMTVGEFMRTRKGRPRFRRSAPEDRTEDGIVFDSKAELARYRELKAMRQTGEVAWWIRQPLFDLAGAKYRADFLIVWITEVSPPVTVEEVKGKYSGRFRAEALRRWKRNAAQVKALYGVEVELVER